MFLAHLGQERVCLGAHKDRVIEFGQQADLLDGAGPLGGQFVDQPSRLFAALGDGDHLRDRRFDLGVPF